MDYQKRLRQAREEMKRRNIGLMFLNYAANLWYLAGIPRLAPTLTDTEVYGDYVCGAYIGADDTFILLAPSLGGEFYKSEADGKPWIKEVRFISPGDKAEDVLSVLLKSFRLNGKGVSLDDRMWAKSAILFESILPDSPVSMASDIIAPMRMIKDADEIALMKAVGNITDEVYGEALKFLEIGITEYAVANEISNQFSKRGVDYPSFNTNVRFSRPGKAGQRKVCGTRQSGSNILEIGDAITFDYGICYKGYCSDFGRTAFMGEPPAEFVKRHTIVMEAQEAAMRAMVSGKITAHQLDRVARNIIEEAGYGAKFIHKLGHGIGVTVHEPPYTYHTDETVLASHMVLAIEPSIIDLEGYFCRLEDLVMVTDGGGVPLTNFSRALAALS